jgi:glycerate dehydrogenase
VKIVVLDGYTLNPGDNSWDALAALGDLTVHDRTTPDEIVPRARGAEVVLTNKTHLDAEALAALPGLRLVGVLATGYNVVDVAAARAHGIAVANVPEYGTESVAQHVIALLLELATATGVHDAAVHAGEWQRSIDFCFWKRPLIEVAELSIGIVGYGRIGRRVGDVARALGMRVLASVRDGRPVPPATATETWCTLDDLFARADVVTLHCPLTADNERFVNTSLLGRMKRSALLINTARGQLIDEAALAQALADGTIAGAGLDVVSEEPIRADNPLLGAPNCVITPHVAWASLAARRRLMQTTAENVRAFLAGAPVNLVG